MKMGRKNKDDALLSKPAINKSNKTLTIMAILVITAGLILWVLSIGRKAESTVTVAMLNQPVYKNEAITTDMLKPYEMIEAEFEKYAIKNKNGEITRRVVLWDEVNTMNGAFAAYSLQADTVLEYRSLVKSRVDNSDTVLYNFPGKDIVQLDIGTSDLNAFKTFLRPGDRLNIEAIYSDNITVEKPDDFGASVVEEEISVFKTTTVFGDIMVADLINANGDSILDIYEEYNQMTIYQQVQILSLV